MTSKLNDVKVAYEDARRAQLVDDPVPLKRLPTWEKLSPEIRKAVCGFAALSTAVRCA